MKMRAFKGLLAGVLALTFGVTLARADEPAPPKQAPAPAGTAPEGKTLTDEGLRAMLVNQGYKPTVEKVGTSNLYWVKISRDGVEYSVSFQISPNKEKLWIIVPLADIADVDHAAPAKLAKLLELNDQIGPCYFRFNRQYKRLYLARAMDNRAVTPALFRDNLERTVDRLVETRAAWQVKDWSEPTAAISKVK